MAKASKNTPSKSAPKKVAVQLSEETKRAVAEGDKIRAELTKGAAKVEVPTKKASKKAAPKKAAPKKAAKKAAPKKSSK